MPPQAFQHTIEERKHLPHPRDEFVPGKWEIGAKGNAGYKIGVCAQNELFIRESEFRERKGDRNTRCEPKKRRIRQKNSEGVKSIRNGVQIKKNVTDGNRERLFENP